MRRKLYFTLISEVPKNSGYWSSKGLPSGPDLRPPPLQMCHSSPAFSRQKHLATIQWLQEKREGGLQTLGLLGS